LGLTLALLLVTPVVAATPLVVAKTAHARPKSDIANVHDRLEPYVAKLRQGWNNWSLLKELR